MKHLIALALIIILFTYITSNMSFADTSNFDEKIKAFSEEYGIKDTE